MLMISDSGYEVKMVLDSVNPVGDRLTTMTWRYPRFVHSEVLTHRDRERNSASSRAIPFGVMMDAIENDPVVPLVFGAEQRGMQMGESLDETLQELAKYEWLRARDSAVAHAKLLKYIGQTAHRYASGGLDARGMPKGLYDRVVAWSASNGDGHEVHKSLANRLTEPFMWITVVMTATRWENLWRLRCHQDAEIHFQKIARMARELMAISEPHLLAASDWHRPWITPQDYDYVKDMRYSVGVDTLNRISVARNARVSYLTHEGNRDIVKDLELFDRLMNGSGFGHMSPYGHVAQSENDHRQSGPFNGFTQYRKMFPNECADEGV